MDNFGEFAALTGDRRSTHNLRMSNRHRAVLDGIGGVERTASLLGLTHHAVRQWYYRGIPPRYWHRVAALSPDVTPEYLDLSKPIDPRRLPPKRRRP